MAQITLPVESTTIIGPVSVTQGTSPWIVAATNLDIRPLVASDVVTVLQGTSPWVISGTVAATQSGAWTVGRTWTLTSGTDSVDSVQSGAWTVAVNNFPAVQPISGTVTANQGTSPWTVSGSVSVSNFPLVQPVSGTVSAVQSGTWTVDIGSIPAYFPVDQGQPALPSDAWYMRITDGVSSVGITGFSLNVNVTNASIPVTQSGVWSTGRTWTLASGTDSVSAVQSGTWNINNISGTVSLPTGAATSANQSTQITSLQLLDDVPAAMNAAFSKGAPAMGQLDDTSTTVATEDNVAPVRITAQRAFHVNLRNNSGTEIGTTTTPISSNVHQWGGTNTTLGQKAMAASVPVVISSDQSTISVTAIPGTGTIATYSSAVTGLVTAALSTDIFTITGSGTKTVKIRSVTVTATRTSDAKTDILLIKRSTANSGGTSTTPTLVSHDSNNAAATAVVRAYTANPTLGTAVGTVRTQKQYIPVASSSMVEELVQWTFGDGSSQPIVLRGTSEVLAVNLNGVTITGPSFNIWVEFTEE